MLTIALPRGKSLEQRTLDLFEKAHINVHREGDALEFPGNAELNGGAFIKPKRIPLLVAEGDFDIGNHGRRFDTGKRSARRNLLAVGV
jgi:ATP phosphoribosyltransferase